jgi:hypothetical protein
MAVGLVLVPVSSPLNISIEAIEASLLAHVPPVGRSVSVCVEPEHMATPANTAGAPLTVTTSVAGQPPVLNMIVEVPVDTPVTTPVGSTVATAVLLLLQPPPVVVSLNTVVKPIHIDGEPVIAPGAAFTTTVALSVQPVGAVKVTVALPGRPAVIRPVAEPIATLNVLSLLHVPPGVVLVRLDIVPWHKVVDPVIAPGSGFTDTTTTAGQPGPVPVV